MILDKLPSDRQPGVFVRRYNGKELTDEELEEINKKSLKIA